jgi:hypothetical protein
MNLGELDPADVLELRRALMSGVIVNSRRRVLAAFLDVRLAQHEAAQAAAFRAELETLPAFGGAQ